MMKRCTICGTGLPAGVLCLEHLLLSTLRLAVKHGTVSDWEQPMAPAPLIMSHKQMLTDKDAISPDWRTQILVTLADEDVLWDDGMDEVDSLGDWIADSIEQYGFPGFEVVDDDE